jgi:glycosyltransferase involved in cell wall biosynthesis
MKAFNSMHHHQLISVIIPVYNCDRYLAEAIQSVLGQTYPVHEILVVDDGSTDQSTAIARQFPQVKLLTQPNQGDATARNLGINYATGDFIAFLDADDRWRPHKLAQQMQEFSADASIDIVFTHVQQFISPELAPSIQAKLHCPIEPMAGQLPTTTMIRRSSLQQIGNFNSQLKLGTFIDWMARAQEANLGVITLPETLAERRIHTTNMGIQHRDSRQDYIQIVKAALDRRRH